ncbi:MAG: oligosaccharide flippase family protein [Bacteroidota bacterium]
MAALQGIIKFEKNTGAGSGALYIFSNCLSKGAYFLLLLYFANALTVKDFGVLSMFNNGVLFLVPFISMGIPQSVNTAYFKKDKATFSHFFSTTLMMPMMATLLIMAVLFVFNRNLQQHYTFPTVLIAMMPLLAFFRFLNGQLLNMVRNSNNPVKYLSINAGRLLAEITLVVFLAGAMEWGWIGCIAGIFISYLMVAVCAFFYFREEGFVVNQFNKKYLNEELESAVPAVVMQLGIFCTGSVAVYFIEHFTQDFAQVGEFSMAAALSAAIMVLCAAMLQHSWPKLHSLLNTRNINYTTVRWHVLNYARLMLLGTGVIIIAIPIVYAVMIKEQYQAGLSYYFFICLGYFFCSINFLLYAFLQNKKERNNLLLLSMLSIIISAISHTVLIGQWGAYGAAVSICIAHFIALGITILFMQKQLIKILSNKPDKTA